MHIGSLHHWQESVRPGVSWVPPVQKRVRPRQHNLRKANEQFAKLRQPTFLIRAKPETKVNARALTAEFLVDPRSVSPYARPRTVVELIYRTSPSSAKKAAVSGAHRLLTPRHESHILSRSRTSGLQGSHGRPRRYCCPCRLRRPPCPRRPSLPSGRTRRPDPTCSPFSGPTGADAA